MELKAYVVTITGLISVDTTVAVMASSEEDAKQQALDGARRDTSEWCHRESLVDEPVVSDVSAEDLDELQFADQRQLV